MSLSVARRPFDLDELEATFRRYLDRDGPDDAPEWAKGGLWMVERIDVLWDKLEELRSGGNNGGVPGPIQAPPGRQVRPRRAASVKLGESGNDS